MLRKLEHGNWKHNLVDFERPGDKVWGQSIDFKGRMSSMRSMEAFDYFRRTSKGEGFKGSEIWEVTKLSPDVSLSGYHNAFLHYELKGLVRDYFHQVRATRSRCTRRNIGVSFVGQEECAAFLRHWIEESVDVIKMKRWELFPHEKFYSPGSAFNSSIRNNPMHSGRVERGIEGHVPSRSLTNGGGRGASQVKIISRS